MDETSKKNLDALLGKAKKRMDWKEKAKKEIEMNTPIQELINQVEQWMIDDKYVQDNPLDYEEYMVHYANQMIEVKGKFIDMCKAMIEKEKEMMKDAWLDGRNSHSNGQDLVKQIKTFNTKEK